jgi:threonine dehydrogenase-like Zn-dependent dehydrogenase
MLAAVMTNWALAVEEVPDPVPGPGQVLARVLACGICGSDLHMLQHGARQRALSAELEQDLPPDPMRPQFFDPGRRTVMGHEFCCEVVEVGPACSNLASGDLVVSMPVAFDERGLHPIGYSNAYPGGYAELMVLNDVLGLRVPNGLPHRLAALTEPLAVGVHAVAKSRIEVGEAAVVLGCGPVGLAVVAELARRGVGPVIAADFSPKRRQLAAHLGAHEVVDPREEPPVQAWRRLASGKPLVMFEAVGVPGMIDQAMRLAPKDARILVVGACMEPDTIQPMVGIGRELSIQFALGYQPDEFATALTAIAEGEVDLEPLLTGSVGVDGVPQAFADLANPERHAKILVEPGLRPAGQPG